MNNKKILNGNKTRIKPDRTVTPLFTNSIPESYTTRDGTVYPLLEADDTLARKIVNNNPK
ncbi:MAG: hypothetical protein LBC82_04675 [Oscillospiraceae bacterium]|jgi:hypothetical protein|nr:hypothetical protein [Oscillospiraceae bacterium]